MFDQLAFIEEKYKELSKTISDPDIIAQQDIWVKYCKEHSDITPIVEKYREYKKAKETIEEAHEMLNEKLDSDFKEMVELELSESLEKVEKIEQELKTLLLPKDPNDEKNVIVEIRGGAGGDEAALFAATLFRMYARYAERKGWKSEIMSSNIIDIGGYKEISFMIEGKGAYSKLKFESGVHRVQRIPSTESGGRIHTSTVTVAVLPEAKDVEVDIAPNDIKVDVFRSSGPGGQSVNTTDSAVRITHEPTGLIVSCQDEKSQHKNRDKAMRILRSRLYDLIQQEQNAEIAKDRKNQVGTGDRSERIRTYNFPQGRVTDHRIGVTIHKIDAFLDGDIEEMIDALITSDESENIRMMGE